MPEQTHTGVVLSEPTPVTVVDYLTRADGTSALAPSREDLVNVVAVELIAKRTIERDAAIRRHSASNVAVAKASLAVHDAAEAARDPVYTAKVERLVAAARELFPDVRVLYSASTRRAREGAPLLVCTSATIHPYVTDDGYTDRAWHTNVTEFEDEAVTAADAVLVAAHAESHASAAALNAAIAALANAKQDASVLVTRYTLGRCADGRAFLAAALPADEAGPEVAS